MREPRRGGAESLAADTAVLKDQLAELERDYATGAIAPQAYEQAKLELKRRLLEDTAVADSPPSATHRMRSTVAAIAVALPRCRDRRLCLCSAARKRLLRCDKEAHIGPAEMEAMVARLAERLEQRPDDVQGWVMLGRSYKVLGRHTEAAQAYAQIETFIARDARLLVEYAEAIALAHGGDLQGKPAALVAKALVLETEYTPAQGVLRGGTRFSACGLCRRRAPVGASACEGCARLGRGAVAQGASCRGAGAHRCSISRQVFYRSSPACGGYCETCRDGRGEGCADRYSLYLCTCRRWPARPARRASPPGQRPTARFHARRFDGDGAKPQALPLFGSGGRRARLWRLRKPDLSAAATYRDSHSR